jgi:plastocyanin
MRIVRIAWLVAATALGGCTYGAPAAATTGLVASVVIDVNLTVFPAGYNPPAVTVAVGTLIQFTNTDSFAHTATAIAGAAFPTGSPFDSSAVSAAGSALSSAWGSGTLPAGGSSQVFVADRPGTYLYGCFFHYSHPMRGQIIVR